MKEFLKVFIIWWTKVHYRWIFYHNSDIASNALFLPLVYNNFRKKNIFNFIVFLWQDGVKIETLHNNTLENIHLRILPPTIYELFLHLFNKSLNRKKWKKFFNIFQGPTYLLFLTIVCSVTVLYQINLNPTMRYCSNLPE